MRLFNLSSYDCKGFTFFYFKYYVKDQIHAVAVLRLGTDRDIWEEREFVKWALHIINDKQLL